MNYRHAFHAGNFADLVKHAALLRLLAELTASGGPLTVIDTHAGRGLYDLGGEEAKRSGEAEAGVLKLRRARDAPPELAPLRKAVADLNGGGPMRRYPGSPWLIAESLRPGDRYIACELRAEEHEALGAVLKGRGEAVRTLNADGYAAAVAECPPRGRVLVLIDPPFERPDDYEQAARALGAILRNNPGATVAIWLPLKDLETFDGFLRRLRSGGAEKVLVAEARLRPLHDPMKMNGCAMVVVNPPVALRDRAQAVCEEVVRTLGDPGGLAKVWKL